MPVTAIPRIVSETSSARALKRRFLNCQASRPSLATSVNATGNKHRFFKWIGRGKEGFPASEKELFSFNDLDLRILALPGKSSRTNV
jgi:hypothetical protein